MLLNFTVSNFRSFKEEQTFSMVASTRHQDHPEHTTPIPGSEHRLLPVAALYGANGAGKSNLVKAMAFLKDLVVRGRSRDEAMGRQHFLLNPECAAKPTEFSIQFAEQGKVFAFGCGVSDRRVETEWLSLLEDGKDISVYQRVTKEDGEVLVESGPALRNDAATGRGKLLELTKIGALPNQLFLTTAAASLQPQDQGKLVPMVLAWFQFRLGIATPTSVHTYLAKLVFQNKEFAEFASAQLREAMTGVDKLRSEVADEHLTRALLMDPEVQKNLGREMEKQSTMDVSKLDGTSFSIERDPKSNPIVRTLEADHRASDGSVVTLPFGEESDGTRRLTHLLAPLHDILSKPYVFVVDEIDRSLHPLLAKRFVRHFLEQRKEAGGQLIFTTHETAFLDLDLLRRDEIWFANKPMPAGATELYSLADYKVRTDLKVDKAYLQGRFEAVPPVELEMPEWVRDIESELHPKAGAAAANQA